ncbi:OLC1v1004151C1 [Oldenlandia corymbosa var. corymbosa]|uniref:OLC1v1004151C1 n=1 Tax=Oldenlandia corymbosa var. corymbosa TaxID=529605 RepID=A0AAV1DE07_OLDCO|nr:OLC1v1004151C1 [Oldenlandia corymbosa var. corymbosa]
MSSNMDLSLEEMCANLSLNEPKKVPLAETVGQNLGRGSCLVRKVIAPKDRILSHNEIVNHFRTYWNVQNGMETMAAGQNKVFFKFNSPVDMRRVQQGSPWTIGKLLFVLTELNEEDVIDEVDFSWVPFWIQIKGLPFGLMQRNRLEISLVVMLGRIAIRKD